MLFPPDLLIGLPMASLVSTFDLPYPGLIVFLVGLAFREAMFLHLSTSIDFVKLSFTLRVCIMAAYRLVVKSRVH